jgi:hypothetical protein
MTATSRLLFELVCRALSMTHKSMGGLLRDPEQEAANERVIEEDDMGNPTLRRGTRC